ERARYPHLGIVRFDRQRAIQHQLFFSIAPETRVTQRNLLQHVNVARIEISRTLEILYRFFPASLTPRDVTLQLEYPGIVRQGLPGNFQFSQCTVVIEISSIKILGTCKVHFARIRTETECRLYRRIR